MECDPNGLGQHDPGAKLDAGKPRMLSAVALFPHALSAVGDVIEYGERRYCPGGWRLVEDGPRRYAEAILRHIGAEACGEESDAVSGLRHAAHTAWNALARLEILLVEEGESIRR